MIILKYFLLFIYNIQQYTYSKSRLNKCNEYLLTNKLQHASKIWTDMLFFIKYFHVKSVVIEFVTNKEIWIYNNWPEDKSNSWKA